MVAQIPILCAKLSILFHYGKKSRPKLQHLWQQVLPLAICLHNSPKFSLLRTHYNPATCTQPTTFTAKKLPKNLESQTKVTTFAPVNETSRDGAEVARWAHNPKVVGSNPAPATKTEEIQK